MKKAELVERGLNSSTDCFRGLHSECKMPGCSCTCHAMREELDAIADVVLAYRPKPKSKGAKRRTRRAKKAAKKAAKDAEDG